MMSVYITNCNTDLLILEVSPEQCTDSKQAPSLHHFWLTTGYQLTEERETTILQYFLLHLRVAVCMCVCVVCGVCVCVCGVCVCVLCVCAYVYECAKVCGPFFLTLFS